MGDDRLSSYTWTSRKSRSSAGHGANPVRSLPLRTCLTLVDARVFFLDIPLDVSVERLTQRGLDPVTGDRFHTHDHPPPTHSIKDRLTQHPTDDEDLVQKRYQTYSIYYDELQEYYSTQGAIHVAADQDSYTVFEAIEAGIVNQISKEDI